MPAGIPDYQKHRIASCMAAGYPIDQIARATGLSEDTIRRQTRQPTEKMKELVTHYRFQQNAMLVKFKMETTELYDECLKVMKRNLTQEKDPRLSNDVAKDILSVHGITFPRDRAGAPQVNTQFNIHGDSRTLEAMQSMADSVKESTELLRSSLPPVTHIAQSRHIHVSEAEIAETQPVSLSEDEGALELTEPPDPLGPPPTGGNGGTGSPDTG